MYISNRHITAIQRRIDYLTQRIDDSPVKAKYDEVERDALQSALKYIDDEQSNVHQHRAFRNGQKTVLKYYKKTLKKAVYSGNVEALQFLLDRTNEWLEEDDATERDFKQL